jgi:hypothetical protein
MGFCRRAEAQAYLSVIPAEAGIHLLLDERQDGFRLSPE